MATHDLTVPLLVGNGVALATLDSDQRTPDKAVVVIAPAYEIARADGKVNWPVPARYSTDTDALIVPGLEDTDSAGDDVVWAIQILWMIGNEVLSGHGPVTFIFPEGASSSVTYPAGVTPVAPVEPPEYGPTWAAQAEANADRSEVAADAAEAAAASIQRNQPGGVAGLTTGGTLYESQMPSRLTPSGLSATIAQLSQWARNPDMLIAGTVTRDVNGAATSAPVVWPDGTPGTYTALTLSSAFPGAVDSYKVTYGSPVTKTFTQPAVTRNTAGAATNVPQIVVS